MILFIYNYKNYLKLLDITYFIFSLNIILWSLLCKYLDFVSQDLIL